MRLSNVRRILFVIGCLACLLASSSVKAEDQIWYNINVGGASTDYVYTSPTDACDAYIIALDENGSDPPYVLTECSLEYGFTYDVHYAYYDSGDNYVTRNDYDGVRGTRPCPDDGDYWNPDMQQCTTEPYDQCPTGLDASVTVPIDSSIPGTINIDGCQYSESGGVSVCLSGGCSVDYHSTGNESVETDSVDYTTAEPTDPPRETTETESFDTGTSAAGNPTETTTTEKTIPAGTEVTDSPDTVEYEQWPDDSYTKTTTTQETIDNGDGTQTIVTTETTEYFQSSSTEGRIDKTTGEHTTVAENPSKSDAGTTVTSTTTDSDGTVISKNKTYEQGESSQDIQEQGEQDMGEGDCGVLPEFFCTVIPELSEKFNEFVDDMEKVPDGVGDEIALPTQEIENPGTAAYSSGLGGASCPQPAGVTTTYGSMSPSYQPFCDLAVKINPYLIAMAYLMAAFIVLGVRK